MSKARLVFGLTYHGSTERPLQGLDNVYGKHISAAKLEQHLRWISRRFSVLTLEELRRRARTGTLPRRPLFIAFHDGYRGNYEVAFPLLQRYKIRADFFVTTAFLEADYRFWVDVLDAALKYTTQRSITIDNDQGALTLSLQEATQRLLATEKLRKHLKFLPQKDFPGELLRTLNQLGWSTPESVPRLGQHERGLTWDHVREMTAAGMRFGSHTHRHVICAPQDEQTVKEEMVTSKQLIEKETGQPCPHFCYPNGSYPASGNDRTDRWAKEVGYSCVLYMISAYNLMHPETFRFTGGALGEGTEFAKLKVMLSPLRFHLRKWRGDRLWAWVRDSL